MLLWKNGSECTCGEANSMIVWNYRKDVISTVDMPGCLMSGCAASAVVQSSWEDVCVLHFFECSGTWWTTCLTGLLILGCLDILCPLGGPIGLIVICQLKNLNTLATIEPRLRTLCYSNSIFNVWWPEIWCNKKGWILFESTGVSEIRLKESISGNNRHAFMLHLF